MNSKRKDDDLDGRGYEKARDLCGRGFTLDICAMSLSYYYLTSVIVLVGLMFGISFVSVCRDHPDSIAMNKDSIAERFGPWDGVWFRDIVENGYSYDSRRMSNVAFYPLYPLAGRAIAAVTGCSAEVSLLIAAHVFLSGSFVLLAIYVRGREGHSAKLICEYTLLAYGLFPTTFYFRMAYTESAFLFVILAAMVGMQRRLPLVCIAFLVGMATAARPVGIAVVMPFLVHVWERERSLSQFFLRMSYCMPLSVWGIAAFMLYQFFAFGDCLVFAKTQIHWYERMPPEGFLPKLYSLLSLEPFWSVYDPSCTCNWKEREPSSFAPFSMLFMNPVFVLITWVLVSAGAVKSWISGKEFLLAVGLLAIPYVSHSFRACMASEARYAAVAFPFYIVLGTLLSKVSPVGVLFFSVVCAVGLAFYSALFVNWYWFF